jgi:hypothetical protein
MEKFGQYRYTKKVEEVHDKVNALMTKNAGIGPKKESFISAIWIENFLSKGSVFLLITKDIIFDNSNGPFEQINVKTISNVENVLQFSIVTNAGKTFTPFKTVILPKELRPLIIGDINNALTGTSDNNDLKTSDADELSKFKKLLDDGAITQDEYDKKKANILGL